MPNPSFSPYYEHHSSMSSDSSRLPDTRTPAGFQYQASVHSSPSNVPRNQASDFGTFVQNVQNRGILPPPHIGTPSEYAGNMYGVQDMSNNQNQNKSYATSSAGTPDAGSGAGAGAGVGTYLSNYYQNTRPGVSSGAASGRQGPVATSEYGPYNKHAMDLFDRWEVSKKHQPLKFVMDQNKIDLLGELLSLQSKWVDSATGVVWHRNSAGEHYRALPLGNSDLIDMDSCPNPIYNKATNPFMKSCLEKKDSAIGDRYYISQEAMEPRNLWQQHNPFVY